MPNQIKNSIADVTEAIGITTESPVQFTSTPEPIYFFFPGGGIVSSSVCENNRPFESARTVPRPDMRMPNAARLSSARRPSRKPFPRVPRAGHLPHDDEGWFRDYSVGCPDHRRGANAMLRSGDIARG
jgi:hypothetical protein